MRKANLVVTTGLALVELLGGCAGGSGETAQTFVAQYCTLVAPCCTQEGLASGCTAQVTYAAQMGTYDAIAGAACLAALTALQSSADFCGGLAVISRGTLPPWAVVPACSDVFRSAGSTPAGQPCVQNSDCAPGPNGDAICFMDFMFATNTMTQTCQTLTGKLGDACFGTHDVYGGTELFTEPTGAICDQSQGVICDQQRLVCVAAGAVGSSCDSDNMCDPIGAYCNIPGAFCAARLPLGATCTGMLNGECAGNAYCNAFRQCTAQGGADAACSGTTTPPDCLSGGCNNGSCTDPLLPLCQ
jgi:hypothetical protein